MANSNNTWSIIQEINIIIKNTVSDNGCEYIYVNSSDYNLHTNSDNVYIAWSYYNGRIMNPEYIVTPKGIMYVEKFNQIKKSWEQRINDSNKIQQKLRKVIDWVEIPEHDVAQVKRWNEAFRLTQVVRYKNKTFTKEIPTSSKFLK